MQPLQLYQWYDQLFAKRDLTVAIILTALCIIILSTLLLLQEQQDPRHKKHSNLRLGAACLLMIPTLFIAYSLNKPAALPQGQITIIRDHYTVHHYQHNLKPRITLTLRHGINSVPTLRKQLSYQIELANSHVLLYNESNPQEVVQLSLQEYNDLLNLQ